MFLGYIEKKMRFLLLGLAMSLHVAIGAAEDLAPITFDEILESALDNSLAVQDIELQSELGRSVAREMESLPNPELSVEVRPFVNRTKGLETEYEVGISQSLKVASFGQRQRVAKLLAQTTQVESQLAVEELSQNLRLAYAKGWALQEKIALTEVIRARTSKLHALLNQGATTGLLPNSLLGLFFAETKRLKCDINGIKSDFERSIAELEKMSGYSLSGRKLQKLQMPKLPLVLKLQEIGQIPIHDRLILRQKLSREQDALARLDAFPAFAPRIAIEHTSEGDDRIIAGVSIDLPLWNRNQAEKSRAKAISRDSDLKWKYYSGDKFSGEITRLLRAARSITEQSDFYRDDILPTLREALSDSQNEFSTGQGSAIQIWQTLKELGAAQDRYLELWVQSVSVRTELSVLLGKEI